MARPSKPLISRKAAVMASIEIIDSEGLEAFSLPRLAKHLGVRAPSLYHHFDDKNEILTEVARYIAGTAVRRPRMNPGPDWPEFFVALALNFRQSILRHRNAAPVLLQHLPRDLFTSTYEDTAQFLLDSGVPVDLHVRILDGMETLSIGAVLMEAMRPPRPKSAIFPNVSAESQPLLAQALSSNDLTQRQLFEGIVRSFLHGIIRDHDLPAPDAEPAAAG
ncbi:MULTISPECIES: TetR family transcriptional regulator [Gordonia]|jgi:AcrR family transcriptional regulator|uniref:TetR family transcriptional regulator n=2 Tax=Gordonia terrae TaxID=2055 RepID=A0AAD0K9I9_9ACTN|nr:MULTISPECIES: TetR family transcriptional regulator [Gordonia]VTR11364.1 transcriptional regulator [Clostridioides difficile]ANY24591.1 TetR family transcriptional regulator [Gordonia terrae]AWO85336.1 TetR family transcriptional regulator [Gordonia terrae]MCG7631273.1 TetR family transcriptional regulator [Gordonia sp. McavH-238-E]UPW08026.1 TetR family transcriptional regulator [Gordonia terrae]